MLGSRGLASLGPFLSAPAGPRGRLEYWGLGDRGLASPVPLLGATQHVAGTVDGVRDGGRGVPAPQIMNFVEEIPLCVSSWSSPWCSNATDHGGFNASDSACTPAPRSTECITIQPTPKSVPQWGGSGLSSVSVWILSLC